MVNGLRAQDFIDFGITCDTASADGGWMMTAIEAELAELRASILSDCRRVPLNERTDMTTVLDRFRLDDKVAIVTGASSGLGVAFAKASSGDCLAARDNRSSHE